MSFVSCGSSDDNETPTYVEPTYTQHEKPQWNNAVDVVKPNEKYPADLTAYIQLPDSMKAYVSNADELAAFCGEEPRGDGSVVDGVDSHEGGGVVGVGHDTDFELIAGGSLFDPEFEHDTVDRG